MCAFGLAIVPGPRPRSTPTVPIHQALQSWYQDPWPKQRKTWVQWRPEYYAKCRCRWSLGLLTYTLSLPISTRAQPSGPIPSPPSAASLIALKKSGELCHHLTSLLGHYRGPHHLMIPFSSPRAVDSGPTLLCHLLSHRAGSPYYSVSHLL